MKRFACPFCVCIIYARSQHEAETEYCWSWEVGDDPLCDGCSDDFTVGTRHECWQMEIPPELLHQCGDGCHPSKWHGPLYDLGSALAAAAQYHMSYGWNVGGRPNRDRWTDRTRPLPSGAAWILLPLSRRPAFLAARFGGSPTYIVVETVYTGSMGQSDSLEEAIMNCDNIQGGK
jgi:hypothetical protein